MTTRLTRRGWLRSTGLAGIMPWRLGRSAPAVPQGAVQISRAGSSGSVAELTSTTGVFIPPRGRAFQKFSFDFPEPSVAFSDLQFGVRIYTRENVFTLARDQLQVQGTADGLELKCSELVWAGGQQRTPGTVTLQISKHLDAVDCSVSATMADPIKAVAVVVRGIPRGRLSGAGAAFADHHDDEVLFGYPFSGGDLFGPQGNAGLTTPLVLIQPSSGPIVAISSLHDRVRTTRFYFQPGDGGYRVELVVEAEGWGQTQSFSVPPWRIARAATIADAARPHFDRLERAFNLPRWDQRADVPDWLKRIALVVTLHGMHFTGYVFNDYSRMLDILKWMATRVPADRVLIFLSAWDGRYYWDYPVYEPAERMGGVSGFQALVSGGRALGFRMMPMFGANAANRRQPVFSRIADAATSKIDGDRLDLNWVDWDNDRHQEGWLSYMNLGVDAWRAWLSDRIVATIARYGVDAYFLDIAGGWVNNTTADMHEGLRRLVADIRAKYPRVAACGEMHYDGLLGFIPLYHSFGQPLVADLVQRHARFFQHLSHPAPGRGSTGVHEAGFGRWDPETLSLTELAIPTLNVVDDTFDRHRNAMEAVITRARERAGI